MGCFGLSQAEPAEYPVSINDVIEDRRASGSVAEAPNARHPEDHRSAAVYACCSEGVCCRDGRCCMCERRPPTSDECLRWWQAYLPGLDLIRAGLHDTPEGKRAPCCMAGALCACVATTVGFYSSCLPAYLCAMRVKSTLMRQRAVWGPFCDDAPPWGPGAAGDPLVLTWQPRVDREAGWQPRPRIRREQQGPASGDPGPDRPTQGRPGNGAGASRGQQGGGDRRGGRAAGNGGPGGGAGGSAGVPSHFPGRAGGMDPPHASAPADGRGGDGASQSARSPRAALLLTAAAAEQGAYRPAAVPPAVVVMERREDDMTMA